MWKEFKEFIARGNVLDLAVAVIIGAAFGKIVTTLVDSVIMPPIGMALGKADFSSLFYDLSGKGPISIADAKAKGLPVIAYGALINDIINFLIIALVVFLIVKAVTRMRGHSAAQHERLSALSDGDSAGRETLLGVLRGPRLSF